MRRSEFNMKEKEEIDSFLLKMSYGFLATHSSDEFPNLIPINYVWFRDKFYFHGARTGRKMTEMKANEKVSFAIADEYSIIPSYFTDPKFACPATSFFKSVIAYGVLEIIEDLDEKVLALTAFMEKLQPEGGYSPFNLEDLEYKKQIKGVNVLRLTPSSISAKFKFGQNRKEEEWNKTVDGLIKRNNPRDSEIVDAMKQYCPF